jgi:AcrR family transcriptional regulator
MFQAEPLSLRERQQAALRREIVTAALDLFEERGFRGTTVEDIAQHVGISARTVFRHFPTKADLVLGWMPSLQSFVSGIAVTATTPADVLDELETTLQRVVDDYVEVGRPTAAESLGRLQKLIATEPDLNSAIRSWESRLFEVVLGKIRAALPDRDDLTVRLLVQLLSAPLVAAVEAWANSREQLSDLYRRARSERTGILARP